jgi:hypothetical protein
MRFVMLFLVCSFLFAAGALSAWLLSPLRQFHL